MSDNARLYNGRLYTLHSPIDPWTGKRGKGVVLHCDGNRVGWFALKREAWRHAELIEKYMVDPACATAVETERKASIAGARLLWELHMHQTGLMYLRKKEGGAA